jgi:hypothetical protein
VLKLDMDKVLLSKGYCGDNSESTLSFFLCLEKGLTHTFINHRFDSDKILIIAKNEFL